MYAATGNAALGIFLLAHGHWVGLVPVAGSALLLWVACTVVLGKSDPGATGLDPSGQRAAFESRQAS